MRIEQTLAETARLRPGATAIVDGDTRVTYRDLDHLSSTLAAALQQRGIAPGDRVVLFLDNGWRTALAIFAALKAGAVVCPVNPSVKSAGLKHIVADCKPHTLICKGRHVQLVETAIQTAFPPCCIVSDGEGTDNVEGLSELLAVEHAPHPIPGDAHALAFILYTSGSTGQAKGVMMSHANVDAASRMIADYLESTDTDVVLSALPLTFTYGLYQLLVTIRTGGCLVLERNFAFPHALLEKARREEVTGLPLVPTMAAMLIQMQGNPATSLPQLRYITNAASALPATHIKALRRLFPQARLFSMYGLTECARATHLPPEEIDRRPDSVGKALPGTQAFVIDDNGHPASPGATGELVVRGPHVMKGYWNAPEATELALRALPDGEGKVLHTGDLFFADEDGFLHFVARRDDIVKIGGEKVAPKAVETFLAGLPGIGEALVYAVPDPLLGHRLEALVVPTDHTLSVNGLLRHCARHFPDAMVPKGIGFRKELPRTASGKPSRRLAAMEAMQRS